MTPTDLRDRTAPARQRVSDGAQEARLRTELAAGEARDRAKVASGRAKTRAQELVVKADPAGISAAQTVGDIVKTLVTGAAAVPLLAARLLIAASRWADQLGEQGRTIASRVEPPRAVRRRRNATTAGWFVGGAAIGFAAGWYARERMRREQELVAVEQDSDYGTEAAQLAERRQA